ncbi:MAG: DUF3084 domain-containing protein [bacterium]
MSYGVFLIALLVFLSGFIAYAGDRLGHRVGKRRISIFGIRPRNTSIIVAVTTGVLIASMTLGMLLVVSRNFRDAFFGLETIRKELASARGQRDYVGKQLDESRKRAGMISKTLNAVSKNLDAVSKTIKEKSAELGTLRKSEAELRASLGELGRQRDSLEKENLALENEKESLEKKVAEIAGRLGDTAKTCLYGDVLYTRDQPLARVVVPAGAKGTEIESQIRKIVSNIQDGARAKGAVVDPSMDVLLNDQIASLKKSLRSTDSNSVVEIRSAMNVLEGEPFITRMVVVENRLVFRDGDVLGTVRVTPGSDRKSVESKLEQALLTISALARSEGMISDMETGKVVSASLDRFMAAVGAAAGGAAETTIEVFARGDTRIADRLHVDFRIVD